MHAVGSRTVESAIIGIVGYGAYVPRYRIRAVDIAAQWGREGGRGEKTVPGIDEDTITISFESGAPCDRARRQSIRAASERSTSVRSRTPTRSSPAAPWWPRLSASGRTCTSRTSSSRARPAPRPCSVRCRMSPRARWITRSRSAPTLLKVRQAIRSSPLHRQAARLTCLGEAKRCLPKCLHTHSITSDTPDFWRREGRPYPSHAGRYTGEPAYFEHVLACARATLEKASIAPAEIRSRGLAHAEREVPPGGRGQARLLARAARGWLPRSRDGQHVFGIVADGPRRGARSGEGR